MSMRDVLTAAGREQMMRDERDKAFQVEAREASNGGFTIWCPSWKRRIQYKDPILVQYTGIRQVHEVVGMYFLPLVDRIEVWKIMSDDERVIIDSTQKVKTLAPKPLALREALAMAEARNAEAEKDKDALLAEIAELRKQLASR